VIMTEVVITDVRRVITRVSYRDQGNSMITVDLAAANVLAILRDLGGIMIPER
jgi:23S rRNA U2552 (ribose-2'-O)-methylase RlmE/FtsJ